MAQAAAKGNLPHKGQNKGAWDSGMKRLPIVAAFCPLLGGCNATPLGYLGPAGSAARTLAGLGWGLIAISAAVCLIVLGLL